MGHGERRPPSEGWGPCPRERRPESLESLGPLVMGRPSERGRLPGPELQVPRGLALTASPAPLGPFLLSHKWNQSCWRERRNLRHGRAIVSIIFPTLLGA